MFAQPVVGWARTLQLKRYVEFTLPGGAPTPTPPLDRGRVLDGDLVLGQAVVWVGVVLRLDRRDQDAVPHLVLAAGKQSVNTQYSTVRLSCTVSS